METTRQIRSPRKNNPPTQVGVNKCGAVSLLSVLRHIGLPDRTIFDITFNTSTGEIHLTPEEGTPIGEDPNNVDQVVGDVEVEAAGTTPVEIHIPAVF